MQQQGIDGCRDHRPQARGHSLGHGAARGRTNGPQEPARVRIRDLDVELDRATRSAIVGPRDQRACTSLDGKHVQACRIIDLAPGQVLVVLGRANRGGRDYLNASGLAQPVGDPGRDH